MATSISPSLYLSKYCYRFASTYYRLAQKQSLYWRVCQSKDFIAARIYTAAMHTKPRVFSYLSLDSLVYLSLLTHSLICNLATDEK